MPRIRKYHPLPAERPTVLDSDDEGGSPARVGASISDTCQRRAACVDHSDRSIDSFLDESISTFDARGHFELCYPDSSAWNSDNNHHSSHRSNDTTRRNHVKDGGMDLHSNMMYDSALLPPSVELSERRNFFDPYSHSSVDNASRWEQQHSWQNDLLEMEEEIDFFSDSHNIMNGSSCKVPDKHHMHNNELRHNVEYGERTPLSGAPLRDGGHCSRADTSMNNSDSIINMIREIVTSVTSRQNPFTSRVGISGASRFSKRMKFSHFKLWIVTTCLLSVICTLSTMRHVYKNTMAELQYEGDARQFGSRPDPIMLKKMEKAKKRWWRKNNKVSSTVEIYREGERQVQDEKAIQQQQKTFADSRQQLQTETDTKNKKYESTTQTLSNTTQQHVKELPVIVKTEEDGSLLIKLPPPKMGLNQSPANVTEETTSIDASTEISFTLSQAVNNYSDSTQDDDTVYIKLPYQQSQQRRSLEEVDPPLRGVSMSDNHPNMKRRPRPSLERHDTKHSHEHHTSGVLDALRDEFGVWMKRHGKNYQTGEEKERRFHVWKKNHFRISEKNQKHGPCRMTGKAVFGHNLFSDLDPEEFQDKFLTGYRGPQVRDHENIPPKKEHVAATSHSVTRRYKSEEMNPPAALSIHSSIQRKLEEQEISSSPNTSNFDDYKSKIYKYRKKFANDCDWWDVSCMLRWIFGYQYIGGTREPVYDQDTYPDALDWRQMGVVSSVHAQGSCGACWAITAVETIESAYAIQTGELLDLNEEEVIACDGTCEMCNGGWPQNAYKYVMKHEGLPVKSADYDGDFLYYLTAALTEESENVSEDDMSTYFAETCPAGVREGGEDGSGSGSRDNGGGGSNYARYGSIKGYGYATERCVCYTNGSGCDCDEQDEQKAVLNIASYGPAAVCLEASLWQNYEGGIMTSDTGCGSAFLDMNHCVQVVGYAFTTSSDNNNEEGSEDHSGSQDAGSRDGESKREGYWIVKNQWSSYWGMNGYVYLAMGDNTCGILNDMTQVYMN